MTFSLANKLTLVAICLAICLPSAFAFWRLPCAKPISIQRADPIVNNGTLSSHVHTIMGASGFHSRASPDSIRNSTCSSCTVKEDNSNYWIPNLFYQHPNGTVQSVPQNGGMLVYYLQRPGFDGEKLHAFPPGFRMLAGNPMKHTSDNTLESQAISYACLNYKQASAETGAFPQKDCPNGLRAQVFFPSCWDGVNLDSADHKSHVAYPSGMNTGVCPSTHPVHLISIFFEVIFETYLFADGWLDVNGKPTRAMPFFWSPGDNTGFGLHGDFMNGWDSNVLQQAVDDCTDMSGIVEYCKHFTFRTDEDAQACRPEYLPATQEQVTGQMTNIPNIDVIPVAAFNPCGVSPNQAFDGTLAGQPVGTCNSTFTNQSAYTPVNGNMGHNTVAADPATKTTNPIDQNGYIGCFTDSTNGVRTMETKVGDGFTPATCRQAVAALGSKYVVFGIQYGSECWASASTLAYKSQGVSTHCSMACNKDPTGWTICGGPNTNQVYSVQVSA